MSAILLAALLTLAAGSVDEPSQGQAKRIDFYGDPLPGGAMARMGTIRLRHPNARIVFAADGKSLISVGADRTVRRWDRETGKYLDERLLELPGKESVAVSLSPDGKVAALWKWSQQPVGIFEVATGKKLGAITAPEGGFYRLAVGPGGKAVVTSSPSGNKHVLRLWDTASGAARVLLEHNRHAEHLQFSADGNVVGAVSLDGDLRLWDVSSGKLLHTLKTDAQGFAFSADGKWVAAGVKANTVKLWDAARGTEQAQLQTAEPLFMSYLTFSPDGKRLAAGGPHGIRIWDVEARKELHRFADLSVSSLTFAPDGKTLAASGGSMIQLWDVDSGKRLLPPPTHGIQIASIAVSPDGKRLATSSYAMDWLCVWDSATGKLLHRHIEPLGGRKTCFSGDGRLVAGGGGAAVTLWEAGTGKEWKRYPIQLKDTPDASICVEGLTLFADGKHVAAIGRSMDGGSAVLNVWDTLSGKLITQRPVSEDSFSHFSPDGELVTDRSIKGLSIQETMTGRERIVIPGIQHYMLAFSPSGKLLAGSVEHGSAVKGAAPRSGKEPEAVAVVELATGKTIHRLESEMPYALAFSSDSRLLAISEGHTVRVWEIGSGKEVLRRQKHEAGPGLPAQSNITALAFFPNRRVLVTGQEDGTALVWKLAPVETATNDLDAKALDGLWADLADEDAGKAYRAMYALADAPARAIPLLAARLRPVAAVDPKHVAALIADLDIEQFAERDAATKELAKLGEQVHPALRRALEGEPSQELRKRVEALLAAPRLSPRGDQLRTLRAIQVLETLATPEARDLLRKLAGGAKGARETVEASETLARMRERR
jgi:WD40 repeat protein